MSRSTSAALTHALRAAGVNADWLPTGQTGVLLQGFGHVIDAVPVDFASGVVERDLLRIAERADLVVVEGQGPIHHPAFGPGAFILFKVCRPEWYLLCHRLAALNHEGFERMIPDPVESARAHEHLARSLGLESRLLGVSVDSADPPHDAFQAERERIEDALGVPCRDLIREPEGASALTAPLTATIHA